MRKTLNKTITQGFFKAEDGYSELTKRWSEIVNSDKVDDLRVEHYVLYAILKGKDWTKAVPLITNQKKLDNGGLWDCGMKIALTKINSAGSTSINAGYNSFYKNVEDMLLWPFKEFVTDDVLTQVRVLVKTDVNINERKLFPDSPYTDAQ